MALLHAAKLTPSKAALISAWLPSQGWFGAPTAEATPVAAYRFDDPAGEVGIESHLLDVDGDLLHVPVTYRAAELPGARDWLIGTMEHSVLGTRWVYDALGDPVYRAELIRVIREADTQVRMFVQSADGQQIERQPTMQVRGSGADTTGLRQIVLVRRPLTDAAPESGATLTGTWPGRDEPTVLAALTA